MNSEEKQDRSTIGRLALFSTMITLAGIAIVNPKLLRKVLKQYREDEIYSWWNENDDLTMMGDS